MRVIYSIGPGDLAEIHRDWALGQPPANGMNVPYARQFLDTAERFDAQAYVLATHVRAELQRHGRFTLEHRPDPSLKKRGLGFHVGQTLRALRVCALAIRHRADLAIVAEGGHWWALAPMRLFGIKIVPSLHCVLWQKYKPLSGTQRLVMALNRAFFRHACFAVMAVSRDIAEQVHAVCGGEQNAPPVLEFIPLYDRGRFEAVAPPVHEARPFRVFFAGRIEQNKGLFELLEIAKRFRDEGRSDVAFDIAGKGPALEALQAKARELGLEATYRCHGFCGPQKMAELLAASHVVVVPTTADFVEGFNKVVAEGVLSGRPVITSPVCPALSYVQDAVLEVAVDDTDGYRRAILRLLEDRSLYDAKRAACAAAAEQFFDGRRGWGAGATEVFAAAKEGRRPRSVSWAPGREAAPAGAARPEGVA